ncbi:MAG: T9SS type A sorting domain-containing protein [Bacteroidales bacterium]|nr:T9SS type A sorting domain-containing protein [Bacteroidales bacterium]
MPETKSDPYKSDAELPLKYDLRDVGLVTAAKYQGNGSAGGNCATFAVAGSLESSWLKMGFSETDLSEQNLSGCHGYEWAYGTGSNPYIATAYLSRMSGPVLESQDPYNTSAMEFFCDQYGPAAYVPEARWLPSMDKETLKGLVMDYGAVYVTIYMDPANLNSGNHSYYYDGSAVTNHSVLLCGWDDNYITDGGTGAWIAKNSWDTAWADQGFFYVSYEDSRFADEAAYFPVRWDLEETDTIFMYDRLCVTNIIGYPNNEQAFGLARFTAPDEMLITHIGVAVADPNTVLDIEIYEDFSNKILSGLLAGKKDILIRQMGYYTLELPLTVQGDFYVKIRRRTENLGVVIPIEQPVEGYADPIIEQDVNWVSNNGTDWLSGNPAGEDGGFNLCIRAYAKKLSGPRALFEADIREACLNAGITYTFLENRDVSSWMWDFGEGAAPATANSVGPHTVQYSSEGIKTVQLIVSGPEGSDTLIRHGYVRVSTSIDMVLVDTKVEIALGGSGDLEAFGAIEYVWFPATMLNQSTGHRVTATPPSPGEYEIIVTGSHGSCYEQDTIMIYAANKLPNDDMCDAMLIGPGGRVCTHSNHLATAEDGEPAPDESEDCYSQTAKTWCIEGGVQNSLWYYFYGPETGVASLRSSGMDNQMAIYRADTCTEIYKHSLIAANDDYSPTELAATLEAVPVIPGAKYYLQIDGSFGGSKGTYELHFYAYDVGLDEIRAETYGGSIIQVYPNPGRGIFNILAEGVQSPKVEIILYNLNGQALQRKSVANNQGMISTRMDLSMYASGIYQLLLIDGKHVANQRIIKE